MSFADALTLCDVCARRGEKTPLQLFQINFDEAIWMCPNQACPYPVGCEAEDASALVVTRSASQINNHGKKRRSREPSRSTSCSSSRSGSPNSLTHGRTPLSPSLKVSSPTEGISTEEKKFKAPLALAATLHSRLGNISKVQNQNSLLAPILQKIGETSHQVSSAISPPCPVLKPIRKTSPPLPVVTPKSLTCLEQHTEASLPKFDQELLITGKMPKVNFTPTDSSNTSGYQSDISTDTEARQSLDSCESSLLQNFAGQNVESTAVAGSVKPQLINKDETSLSLPPHPSRIQEAAQPSSDMSSVTSARPMPIETDSIVPAPVSMEQHMKPDPVHQRISNPLTVEVNNLSSYGAISFPRLNPGPDTGMSSDLKSYRPFDHQQGRSPKLGNEPSLCLDRLPPELCSPERSIFLNSPEDLRSAAKKNSKKQPHTPNTTQKLKLKGVHYFQWQNKDALCWLDVAMCLLVHSRAFHNIVKSTAVESCPVAKDLLNSYAEAQSRLNKALELKRYQLYGQKQTILLQTSLGIITVKTGGGDASQMPAPNQNSRPVVISTNLSPIKNTASLKTEDSRLVITTEELQQKASQLSNEGRTIMSDVRERVWRYLYPKLKCEKGSNDSPVFALPFLFGEDAVVKKNFLHKYEWRMTCNICGYKHSDVQTKSIITLPAVPRDFTMRKPYLIRPCFKCHGPDQRMDMVFDTFPPMFFAHFVEGLHKPRLSSYDFFFKGQHYTVTGIVQYRQNPDHFVAWVRNPTLKMWMECNDLQHPLCQYKDEEPYFPSSQVHIVMWTRKNIHTTTAHSLPEKRELPQPKLLPLKGVLKTPKSSPLSPPGSAQRKILLDFPKEKMKDQRTSLCDSLKTIKQTSQRKTEQKAEAVGDDLAQSKTGNLSGGESKVSNSSSGGESKAELLKRLISGAKKPSAKERLERIHNMQADFRMRKKMQALKPAELAKHILSHGLIPGLSKPLPPISNYLPPTVNEEPSSTPVSNNPHKFVRRATSALPAFSGYVPKTSNSQQAEAKLDKKTASEKTGPKSSVRSTLSTQSLTTALDPNTWQIVNKYRRGRKRKMESVKKSPVKHVKISESNVIIGPGRRPPAVKFDVPYTKTSTEGMPMEVATETKPPDVSDVLDELCEKLDIPNVDTCAKDVDSFSLEELFESGKAGERVKPIESSVDMNVDFDLDMFL